MLLMKCFSSHVCEKYYLLKSMLLCTSMFGSSPPEVFVPFVPDGQVVVRHVVPRVDVLILILQCTHTEPLTRKQGLMHLHK